MDPAGERGEALLLLASMFCPKVDRLIAEGVAELPEDVDVDWPARWKTGTFARLAISTSPICQCMASAARQGSCISFAIFSHMSFLNLRESMISLEY